MNADQIPIPTRLRSDLQWSPYSNDRPDLWIARDPIHLEYYFFSSVEKAIALCLDGKSSVHGIVQMGRRIDTTISASFVRNLIRRLDQSSLLLNRKWRRPEMRRRPSTIGGVNRASSWVAWRVPLFDPSKAVELLVPVGTFLFGRAVLSFGLAAVLVCFLLLANRWTEFVADFATLQSGMRGDRLLIAGLLLLGIKGLHEFGHAIACRSAGAECREMGVYFFFIAPCMYCDVSDIWRVSSRWKRIVVSAAGIITEIAIALVAFVIWYTSGVPWLRGVAVQVMLLCSVVTILVNANPLLRYDGYYILSDGMSIPNLADQAREAWSQLWRNWVFGTTTSGPGFRSIALALYHVASSVYRCFLMALLIWGVNHWLLQQRLGGFGVILSAVLGMAMLTNLWGSARSSHLQSGYAEPVRWLRIAFWLTAISTLVWVGGTWEFRQHLFARGVLEPGTQVTVYARHAGMVSHVSGHESAVRLGDPIVAIESPELELQRIQSIGELNVAMVRLRQAASRSVDDPLASQQLAELEKSVEALQKRLEKVNEETTLLQVRSQIDGIFIDSVSEQTKGDVSGRIVGQSVRLGVLSRDRPFVERGQTLGDVVSSGRWRLRTFVNELEIDQCRVGANALVRLDQLPGVTISGRIMSIAEDRLERTPSKLLGDQLFASTLADSRSESKPEQTTYSLIVEIDLQDFKPIANGLASVQIEVAEQTMFASWIKMLRRSWRIGE
jgi:putative peptide zinc metalloprotease protein